jgi:GT2 family glycosyltransferase
LKQQTFSDFEWLVEVGTGIEHDLNRAFNKMVKRATGELLVFYQDYIRIPPDGLEQFWKAYLKDQNTFFTAPVGKVKMENYTDEPRWDWRAYKDANMTWNMWEIDWGACPKDAIFKIGGFDEELDKHWSCDNVNVGYRANMHGFKFDFLPDNKALAYDHDATIPHPFRQKYNPNFNNERLREFDMGLKIDYLGKSC